MEDIHFYERIFFVKEKEGKMNEKLEYVEQWEVSSKYFYDKNYYNWMQTKIKDYNIILEVGCGTGYSTLSLLENGHKVIALDKNSECIEKAKILIQQNGYFVGNLSDADVLFIKADIAVEEFYSQLLGSLHFDVVICNIFNPYSNI